MLDVLIVDDHEPMRAMLRRVLERAGARVGEAATGEQALAAFAAAPAPLVIFDQSMPGMSGIELTRALRTQSDCVKLVMLTGHAKADIAVAARAAGADAVLVKPIAPSALLAAIASLTSAA
jgi:two-component system sensor histidine kinase EvgS